MQTKAKTSDARTSWYWLCPVAIAITGVLGIAIACPFMTATGETSHFQLPGVCLFVLTALICCTVFFVSPSCPLWCKAIGLLLLLPPLFFAVLSIMLYCAFGVDR